MTFLRSASRCDESCNRYCISRLWLKKYLLQISSPVTSNLVIIIVVGFIFSSIFDKLSKRLGLVVVVNQRRALDTYKLVTLDNLGKCKL